MAEQPDKFSPAIASVRDRRAGRLPKAFAMPSNWIIGPLTGSLLDIAVRINDVSAGDVCMERLFVGNEGIWAIFVVLSKGKDNVTILPFCFPWELTDNP